MTERPVLEPPMGSPAASGDIDLANIPLPDFPDEGVAPAARGQTGPCDSVTRQALQAVIDGARRAREKADENSAKNNAAESGGWAAAAAIAGARAQELLEERLAWLDEHEMFGPSGSLTNHGGGYAVHETARDVIRLLYFERIYTAISALYARRDNRDPSSALACVSLVTPLLESLESLSADAVRCYLRMGFPDA